MIQEKEIACVGGNLRYHISRDEVIITGYNGLEGIVEIPETIENLPVTEIEKKVFVSSRYLREVTLPATLKRVGDWAFGYCRELEKVTFKRNDVWFGKVPFLDCSKLNQLEVPGLSTDTAVLLAAAVTLCDTPYMLQFGEAGSKEWYRKWDARLQTILQTDDSEGYSKQVLCGEEDYGSTDYNAYLSASRKRKARLAFLRLCHKENLDKIMEDILVGYLLAHTKGCESEETFTALLEFYPGQRQYYQTFAQIGGVNAENIDSILTDLGEKEPEMKAFFLKYQQEHFGHKDLFADLEL